MAADITARARVATAASARELADDARAQVARAADGPAVELVREWRRLRVEALAGLDCAVILMLLEGASWADVACALGRDEAVVRAQYLPQLHAWTSGVDAQAVPVDLTARVRNDDDPVTTAHALDQWLARHTDPWEEPPRADLLAALLTERA